MYIYLVRHGQSVWNAEERHQGWQDVPLSPLGEQQAARIGQRLKDQSFDYYFSSPIYRCYQTASAIVEAQGKEPGSTLERLEGLREGRLGARFEGMFMKDMIKEWSKEEKRRFRDDYTFKFDDGESVQEIMARSLEIFRQIALLSEDAPPPNPEEDEEDEDSNAASRDVNRPATPEVAKANDEDAARPRIIQKTALVVAHKINVQMFILQALDATEAVARRQVNIDRLEISNCALSIIEVNLKGKHPHYRLLSTNDVNHLSGLKPPPKPEEAPSAAK